MNETQHADRQESDFIKWYEEHEMLIDASMAACQKEEEQQKEMVKTMLKNAFLCGGLSGVTMINEKMKDKLS